MSNETIEAFEKVQQAVADLRQQYHVAGVKMDELRQKMAALPKMRPPFEDMKAGILELIDAAGQRYVEEKIKPMLISFAVGGCRGVMGFKEDELGKPIFLGELEGAVTGTHTALSRAQLINQAADFDNLALYAVAGESVKALFSRVMDDITPADFGYDCIHPDKIGPSRAGMREQLAAWQTELDRVSAQRGELKKNLHRLGVIVQ